MENLLEFFSDFSKTEYLLFCLLVMVAIMESNLRRCGKAILKMQAKQEKMALDLYHSMCLLDEIWRALTRKSESEDGIMRRSIFKKDDEEND